MGFFSRLVGSKQKEEPEQVFRRTPLAVEQRIRNILNIRELEAMPQHAARAFQLASDPKAKTSDFVDIIESDEALGARIIRVANSIYFFRGTPANDIEKAISSIGLNELRCLLSATMLKNMARGSNPEREQIWGNAVATGICCRLLSAYVSNVSEGEAFLAGLVHDIGKLVMIRRANELYKKVLFRVGSGEVGFLQAEDEVFETDHIEVGKWVAERGLFPTSIILALEHHHDAWAQEPSKMGENTSLALLVKTGDTIAHAAGFGHQAFMRPFQRRCQEDLPNAFRQIGLREEEGAEFMESVAEKFEEEMSLYEGEFK